MTNYRSLIGASLIALVATAAAPAFAQQGAPGGSLYKDPQSRSYVQSDKAQADAAKTAGANSAPVPAGAASGEGASPPASSGLIGPRFGGG